MKTKNIQNHNFKNIKILLKIDPLGSPLPRIYDKDILKFSLLLTRDIAAKNRGLQHRRGDI